MDSRFRGNDVTFDGVASNLALFERVADQSGPEGEWKEQQSEILCCARNDKGWPVARDHGLDRCLPDIYNICMSETKKKIAKKFVISGRVQGVGYRFFAEDWAEQLGIAGNVKNLWDGTVEVYAIGESVSLEAFKLHLAEGPRAARVAGVSESDEVVDRRYVRFTIEGGW